MAPKVISASRRTDLLACYPRYLKEKISEIHSAGELQALVIWTKNPANLLLDPGLNRLIVSLPLVYIHLTITGLGGTRIEPGIPPAEETLRMLPELIKTVKSPDRVTWRFDPLLRLYDGECGHSNIYLFRKLAREVSSAGIKTCRTSWLCVYGKVKNRVEKSGCSLYDSAPAERAREALLLEREAAKTGITIQYCASPGFPRSRCIDGALLNTLHPSGASAKRARGQRALCGCTESLDIGSYSMKCGNACLYCYANPAAG